MGIYNSQLAWGERATTTKTATGVQDCLLEDSTAPVDGFVLLVSDDPPPQKEGVPDKNIHQLSSCGGRATTLGLIKPIVD